MSAISIAVIGSVLLSALIGYFIGWDRGYRECLADQESARRAPPTDYRQDF